MLKVLSPEINQLGCEVYRSPPSSVEVKHKWSYEYTSTPTVYRHGTDRQNFTSYFYLAENQLRGLTYFHLQVTSHSTYYHLFQKTLKNLREMQMCTI